MYLTRKMKARQMFEEGKAEQVGTFSFIVWSQATKGLAYHVFNDDLTKYCECPDNERTRQDCKHIMAVDLLRYQMVKEVIAK